MTNTLYAGYWCGSVGSTASTKAAAAVEFFETFQKHDECIIRPVDRLGRFLDSRGDYVVRVDYTQKPESSGVIRLINRKEHKL